MEDDAEMQEYSKINAGGGFAVRKEGEFYAASDD